jgi:chemotaxis protein MotB
MTSAKLATWTVVLGVLSLAVGCADKNKQQIQALGAEKLGLQQQIDSLGSDLKQAQADRADLARQLEEANAQMAGLQAQLRAAQTAKPAPEPPKAPAGWESGINSDKVTLDTDILFSSGKAELTAEGKRRLDKIVTDLKGPYAGMPIRVYGYTDNEPIRHTKGLWADNLDLSANRAMGVTRYLISQGLPGDRIETVAMGETKPAASNAAPQGRAKNRRVEIIVIKTAAAAAAATE